MKSTTTFDPARFFMHSVWVLVTRSDGSTIDEFNCGFVSVAFILFIGCNISLEDIL